MSWAEQMGVAYSDGLRIGKEDRVAGIDRGKELAAKQDFSGCFYEGYCHGWGKKYDPTIRW